MQWRDKEFMEDIYLSKGMSQKQIAEHLGCTETTIWKWIHRHGIPCREQGSPFKHGCNGKGYAWRRVGGRKRLLQHREVAASVLGRSLACVEVVHHCNGVKNDNRPENLWVFADQKAHLLFHRTGEVAEGTIKLGEVQDAISV